MISIILAAGQGTRMRPLSYVIPKVLLPVRGKPVLNYLIENMKDLNINGIYVVASDHVEAIQTYIEKTGMDNVSVVHGLGWETGGDLSIALEIINKEEDTIVMNGDIVTDISIKGMYEDHLKNKPYVTMGIFNLDNKEEIKRFGRINIDEKNMITNFAEKSENFNLNSMLVNTGFYIFDKKIIEERKKYLVPKKFKIEKDLFPELSKQYKLHGSICNLSYWWDVGTMDSYLQAEHFFINNRNIIPP